MKRSTFLLLALFAVLQGSVSIRAFAEPTPTAHRERTEWTDVWIPKADQADKPRALLVGDSITKGYYDGVSKRLSGSVYVARLTTSLCVCDPAFIPTLKAVLAQASFDLVHFNNGLHGVDYTEEQYQAGYERALRVIREIQPDAKLIIALSTPLKAGSEKDHLNPQVDARNRIASQLAESVGAVINDLHAPMKGHAEYYGDPYHFKGNAIAIQATQVADVIRDVLAPVP